MTTDDTERTTGAIGRTKGAMGMTTDVTGRPGSTGVPTFSFWMPERTRRSSCIWPPTPSSRPRWTHMVRIYVPASQLTQNTPASQTWGWLPSIAGVVYRPETFSPSKAGAIYWGITFYSRVILSSTYSNTGMGYLSFQWKSLFFSLLSFQTI